MEKKNTALVVLVVILSLLVGTLGGYLISDKLVNNKNNNQINKPNDQDQNQDVTPEPSMSAYEKFVLEYKKSMKESIDTNTSENVEIFSWVPDNSKQIKNITLKKDGTATINYYASSSYNKKYPNGQVLDGKYIILDVKAVGSGGYYMYFLIKEDGSVTAIDEFSGKDNNELKIEENYNNYKEITSIKDYIHTNDIDNQEYDKYVKLDKNKDGLVFTDINGNTY